MIGKCCICEAEFNLAMDEYIDSQNNDYICDRCATEILENIEDWIDEWELRKN